MARVASGRLAAATSFYALHEVYLFALDNAPDFSTGAADLYPLVSREERRLLARNLSALPDSSDMPHAVAALRRGCEAMVAYDEHFRAIAHVIPYKTPADCV